MAARTTVARRSIGPRSTVPTDAELRPAPRPDSARARSRVYSWAPTRSRMPRTSVDLVGRSAPSRTGPGSPAAARPSGAGGLGQGVDQRQRLLARGDVGRLLAGAGLVAPDAEQVVVELEGQAQRPAEAAVGGDDRLVVGGQHGAGLGRAGDERGGLAADHVEVVVDRHPLVVLGRPDVHELALAQRQAGLVVEAHQAQDARVVEAFLGQPVERHAAEREQRVAGVDGLGHAGDRSTARAGGGARRRRPRCRRGRG